MKTPAIRHVCPLLLAAVLGAGNAWAERACAGRLGQTPANAALGSELSLLSWNIQKTDNDGWQADLQALAAGSQLVFIQEALLEADIPALLPAMPDQSFAPGYRTENRTTGVMTLGSALPSLHCQFAAMEPWLGTPKAAVATEYALAGREDRLLAINLHAVNFSFGVASLEAQLRELTALLAEHVGPAIVAGDLNTWSDSRQQLVDRLLGEQGLEPVSFAPDQRSRPFGRALDHVYLRGLRAEAAEAVPVDSSDHNPLRVRLALE